MHCVSMAVVRLLLHHTPGMPHRNGCPAPRCATRSMPLRNVVANLEQWLSVVIKRVLTGNQMVAILRSYYKS